MVAQNYKYKNYASVLWVFSSFMDYAEKSGLRLDDENLRYIADCLLQYPTDERKKIAKLYVVEYLTSFDNQDGPSFARHGLARRLANTWLRENKHAFYENSAK